MKYHLLNLNLGENPTVDNFEVGPYHINLVPDYAKLQKRLFSIEDINQNPDIIDGRLIWKKTSGESVRIGENIVTATVECNQEPPAILSSKATNGIWDLTQILSFLSKHRVMLSTDEKRYPSLKRMFGYVDYDDLPAVAAIAWKNRTNFNSNKEKIPLWFYLHLNDSQHAEINLLLGCISLEIIQSVEIRNVKISKSKNNEEISLKKLIKKINEDIEKSEISKDRKNSFRGIVSKWNNQHSGKQFENLLLKYNLINDSIKGLPRRRMEWINKLRNGVIHEGNFRYPKWIKDDELAKEVAIFISENIIRCLVEVYLYKKFNLDSLPNVEYMKHEIENYIYYGSWYGENIEWT